MKQIYFSGAIRGGREDREMYTLLINYLKQHGEVLTENIYDRILGRKTSKNLSDREIYERDMKWLQASHLVVAEVSTPSLGVGIEIAKAADMGKPVCCLYRRKGRKKLSAMVAGHPQVKVFNYSGLDEAGEIISRFIKEML